MKLRTDIVRQGTNQIGVVLLATTFIELLFKFGEVAPWVLAGTFAIGLAFFLIPVIYYGGN